jgi:hypothetical protein
MTQRRREKQPKGGDGKPVPESRTKLPPLSWTLIVLAVAVALAGVYLVFKQQGPSSPGTEQAAGSGSSRRADETGPGRADFQALVGNWIRPDGGYVISIRSVDPDGRVDAGYLNPRPIHVSEAEASAEGRTIKLFIELQAAGYPGSTYELAYDAANDRLVGVYFQAAMQQRFNVVFFRNP